MTTAGTVQPAAEVVGEARRLFNELGAKEAAERLGVSQSALLRMAAGGSVRAGTIALATAAIRATTTKGI
jgi:hypothetical protein